MGPHGSTSAACIVWHDLVDVGRVETILRATLERKPGPE